METGKKNLLKIISYLSLSLVTVLGFITIVASGRGGSSSIEYDGLTTPAAVTAENAEELAVAAYEYAAPSSELTGLFGAVQANKEVSNTGMNVYALAMFMKHAVEKADIGGQMGTISQGAVQSEKFTEEGECGGSVTFNLSADDETGEFEGTIKFNDYCEDGVVMDGKVDIEGTIGLSTFEPVSFEITFSNLTEEMDGFSMTLDGMMSISPTGFSMDMYIKDNNLDEVYWINDYNMTITEYSGYVNVTGRFYYPTSGYVDVSTPAPLRIYDEDYYPSSGTLVVDGDSSSAMLTALSSSTYQITGDLDDDGDYDDYDSGILYW